MPLRQLSTVRGQRMAWWITTKSGKEGRSDIRLNVSTGISKFANKGRIKYADSDLYVETYNDGVERYNLSEWLYRRFCRVCSAYLQPIPGLPDTDWLDLITKWDILTM